MELSVGAYTVFNILDKNGYEAYFVGGSVRDSLMGISPVDFDIATNAHTNEMIEIFSDFRLVTSGSKHGTVGVVTESGVIECTTYRVDGEYLDSRHPQSVKFSKSLIEDIARRDFTINAMAYRPDEKIIDPFGGARDIRDKVVRTVGLADTRFKEDALRILRGMRFCSTLGFSAEKETALSIKRNAGLLKNISKERITSEFGKILTGQNAAYVIKNFGEVFAVIIPDLAISENVIQKTSLSPADFEIRLFILLERFGRIPHGSLLRLSSKTQRSIENLFKMKRPANKAEVKYLLNEFGVQSVKKYFSYLGDSALCSMLDEIMVKDECYKLSQLAVGGNELNEIGFSGRETGKALSMLLGAVIDGAVKNEKCTLIDYLKEHFL